VVQEDIVWKYPQKQRHTPLHPGLILPVTTLHHHHHPSKKSPINNNNKLPRFQHQANKYEEYRRYLEEAASSVRGPVLINQV
jgi:hypothetical protein